MIAIVALLCGCGLHLVAGLVALWQPGRLAATLTVIASVGLGVAGITALAMPDTTTLLLPWPVPGGGIAIAVDALSGAFLLPIAALGAVTTIYARGYWDDHPSAKRTRAAVAVLLAGMALVVTARQGVWFLLCWEAMALAAWVGLCAEHREREVRLAGWTYLVFTHLGTACLTAMAVLLWLRTGGWEWQPLTGAAHRLDGAIVLLAIVGFGAKAGLLPLHAWLPGAHANAPSHISALLSGVMLKTGIYGILRITGLLPEAATWWGVLLIVLGAATALYGIASAVTQADYKRLLAYSSIENLGIITMAVGLAVLGRATGMVDLALLAGVAAILHTWHHAVFKGLLFCGAGAVLHATHTRRLDRLGGLLGRMPRAGGLWIIGCAAAAGLPGLAGFASEWPLYLAGFTDLRLGGWTGVVVVIALALCGALAIAAYTGLIGGTLLGVARSPDGMHAHDPPASMLVPMALLAIACLALPIAAPWTVALAAPAMTTALRLPAVVPAVPGIAWLASGGAVLAIIAGLLWWRLNRRLASAPQGSALTWDCGYAAPTARMQYTVSSFGALLGREVAPYPIVPPAQIEPARGLFPEAARVVIQPGDGILDRWIMPLVDRGAQWCLRLRLLQQGHLHAYLAYILITVLVLVVVAVLGKSG